MQGLYGNSSNNTGNQYYGGQSSFQQQYYQQGGGNQYGGNSQHNYNQNQSQSNSKDSQISQLKSMFPSAQHKQMTNNGQQQDIIEFTVETKKDGVKLPVPIAMVLGQYYPSQPPKVYIRSKLKHNLFEIQDQVIEFQVSNVMQWNPQSSTLCGVAQTIIQVFEKDPPQQEKIVEDVNKLLSVVNEQDFKNIILKDQFQNRSYEELKALQNATFQELICSSPEYKKIAQNLLDVVSFNEKTASEVIAKRENLENQKQSLEFVAERIKSLMNEYNDKVATCNKFKDAFSKQAIQEFVDKEIKKINNQTLDIEENARNSMVSHDTLQLFFEQRKRAHQINIINSKLPHLNYQ